MRRDGFHEVGETVDLRLLSGLRAAGCGPLQPARAELGAARGSSHSHAVAVGRASGGRPAQGRLPGILSVGNGSRLPARFRGREV